MLSRNRSWLLLLHAFLAGCGAFVNLKPIGFTTYPGADNTVLPTESSSISVCFDTPVDKLEAQKILSVNSTGSVVKGDLDWLGDTLFFTPLEPWQPGLRYTVSLNGTIFAMDGREERISRYVSFYAVHSGQSPYALDFSPPAGASVGVHPAGGAFVRIVFSEPMDRFSADAFSLNGVSSLEFIWSQDDTVLEVHPKTPLNPWTVYNWTVSTKAKGKNGVALGREISGHFVTDADRLIPAVTEVFPLIRGGAASQDRWIRTSAPMESGFGSGQAIGIEFNKAMNESVLRNIRFEPSLAGHAEMWKDTTVVFIPDRDPEPERHYTLYVSASSQDTEGLKMEKDYSLSFAADIPYLAVVMLDSGCGETRPEHNESYPALVADPEGIITIALKFSHIMETSAQADTVLSLRLEPYFPGTLRPIALRSAQWGSSDTVLLKWEGITKSTAGEKHFYRLVLPGGRGGISDGKGSYLKEDLHFYFAAEDQGVTTEDPEDDPDDPEDPEDETEEEP